MVVESTPASTVSSTASSGSVEETVAAIRAFSRFYTRVLGLLDRGMLDTEHSLTEVRVLYEVAQDDEVEVAALRQRLSLDGGYLSRVLSRLAAVGAVSRRRSSADGRRQVIRLTDEGRRLYRLFGERADRQVAELLAGTDQAERRRLVGALGAVRAVLDRSPAEGAVVLRAPASGDHGWVVERHGALYAREYGWDETFEALVAKVAGDFVDQRRTMPGRVAAWIAEVDGERVGCVYCVEKDAVTAQLRLLLVDPRARGLGVGSRLVEECIRFARRAGYRRLVLWTNHVLVDARRIYERAGFTLVEEEPHRSFGHDLVGQVWGLDLV